jgi:hypothetical protein
VGLFDRSGGAQVTVIPAVVSPRQPVEATITTDRPMTKVSAATVEWGYTNFYRCHWAGRADAAAAAGNDSLLMMDQVGTNYGSERDTDDWVGVTKVELPIATDEFTGSSSSFTVPSWAPASSPVLARWSCRLTVRRGGRDVDTRGDFTVVIGPDDLRVEDAALQRVSGSGDTDLDIALASPIHRAGDTINGQLTLTPHSDLPDGEVGVYWQRHRDSHPLTRSPAAAAELAGRPLHLGRGIPLRAGTPVVLPFSLSLPDDAAPTASAVHSSLRWSIEARMFYNGCTSHLTERVRRAIVVVNAP